MDSHNPSSNYILRIPDEIAGLIRGMHPQLKQKIKNALKKIITKPYEGKSLRAELKGLKSYKVSRFRIIYRLSPNNCIEIVAIGPRKTIYEITFYIINREKSGT